MGEHRELGPCAWNNHWNSQPVHFFLHQEQALITSWKGKGWVMWAQTRDWLHRNRAKLCTLQVSKQLFPCSATCGLLTLKSFWMFKGNLTIRIYTYRHFGELLFNSKRSTYVDYMQTFMPTFTASRWQFTKVSLSSRVLEYGGPGFALSARFFCCWWGHLHGSLSSKR